MRTSLSIIALVSVIAACNTEPMDREPVFDEASIDNVWHKAKLRGVSFRAIGQEPGWLLEITDGKEILLVTDYGANRESYPFVDPVVFQQERRTLFTVGGVAIEIRGESCTDSMSGEVYAVAVTVTQPRRTLTGCGRALY